MTRLSAGFRARLRRESPAQFAFEDLVGGAQRQFVDEAHGQSLLVYLPDPAAVEREDHPAA
ncbi:hypothetical protein [Actinoalloteichus sp. AHMU CJ021]|uniref:hypothetical protein n=1 Tax=Actinoalloteichus sp. AHMU CJ021 TaxID=2072503 RepID=UPI00268078CB